MTKFRVTKEQLRVISIVSFGNVLEWFEVYLYAYWAPILSKLFFNFDSYLANLISVFLIFGSGFLARPLGAILFGHLADSIGRKNAFTISIIFMTIPTLLMGLLPTYAQIGFIAPLCMVIVRLLQSLPSAGEAPGAFCFLYENADVSNRRFMTSWGGFGNQIGAIIAVAECFFMEKFLSQEFLMTWGWRISFWTGGAIGLLGIYLRHQLHETPVFKALQEHHRISKSTIVNVINNHKKTIGIGIAFGVVNAASFYLIASYIPVYFNKMMGLSTNQNVIITLTILVLTTILLPFFGILGDRFNNRSILIASTAFLMILLYPLYISITNAHLVSIVVIGGLCIIPITCITALIPYLLTHLFPTPVRFTCVGLSFNLADGIVGGFTPAIALFLLEYTANQAAFCWFIMLAAVISLISYFKIKA